MKQLILLSTICCSLLSLDTPVYISAIIPEQDNSTAWPPVMSMDGNRSESTCSCSVLQETSSACYEHPTTQCCIKDGIPLFGLLCLGSACVGGCVSVGPYIFIEGLKCLGYVSM